MQPIGPLMREHRLIERMIGVMEAEVGRIEAGARPNRRLIDKAVDFFGTYADSCHHGKEENLLFKALDAKPLSDHERAVMGELVEEHAQGREKVAAIFGLNRSLGLEAPPQAVARLVAMMADLAGFYRAHILKEDKDFFFPVMRHFSRAEMDRMLAAYEGVDARVLHEHFNRVVALAESA